MTEKSKAITLVCLLIVLLTGLFLYEGIHFYRQDIQQHIQQTEEEIITTISRLQEYSYHPYVKRIKNLLETNPEIPAVFASGDREALYRVTLPKYRSLQEENQAFYVMHFHRPDTTSFLRMHWPDFFDDDLSGVRPIIVATNTDHKPHQGYEVGRHGPFYRVVHPVFYQERYIGALEFGIRVHQVLDILQGTIPHPATTYFTGDLLTTATRIHHSPVKKLGTITLFTHDNPLFDQLPVNFIPQAKSTSLNLAGEHYRVHTLPIFKNYLGKEIGGLMVLQDISPLVARERGFIRRFIGLSLLLIASVVTILLFTFGRLMNAMEQEVSRRQESESRYRQLFEQMPVAALLLEPGKTSSSHLIKAANSTAQQIDSNIPLPGTLLENIFPVEECKELYTLLDRAAEENTSCPVPPFTRRLGDRELTCKGSVYPLASGNLVLLYEDISREKALEAEQHRLETRLQRAQKMEAIGLLAGGVAHDLNNILSGLVSYPELLLHQLPEDSSMRTPLESIQQSGQRAADVVADLLTVARGVATSKDPADLNEILRDYLASLEGQKTCSRFPEISIQTRLAKKLPLCSCSPVHIQKVFMNLLTNSLEAIQGAGKVVITTRSITLPADYCPEQSNEAGLYVCLEICDKLSCINSYNISAYALKLNEIEFGNLFSL